jgi:hypothetical protein
MDRAWIHEVAGDAGAIVKQQVSESKELAEAKLLGIKRLCGIYIINRQRNLADGI